MKLIISTHFFFLSKIVKAFLLIKCHAKGFARERGEQCAILVHYKGKCTVKTGSLEELKPQCSALLDAGLSAELI